MPFIEPEDVAARIVEPVGKAAGVRTGNAFRAGREPRGAGAERRLRLGFAGPLFLPFPDAFLVGHLVAPRTLKC